MGFKGASGEFQGLSVAFHVLSDGCMRFQGSYKGFQRRFSGFHGFLVVFQYDSGSFQRVIWAFQGFWGFRGVPGVFTEFQGRYTQEVSGGFQGVSGAFQ